MFHFSIAVEGDDPADKYYMANNDFQVGNDWYNRRTKD